MAKPSIFSSNYKQEMRRRRINITLLVLIVVLSGFFFIRYQFNKRGIDILNFKFEFKTNKQNQEYKKDKDIENIQNAKQEKVQKAEAKSEYENIIDYDEYIYTSNTNRQFTIRYKEENGQRTFIDVISDGIEVDFDVSKDGKKIVFDDKENQNIIVFDIDGKEQDITIPLYKSKKSGVVLEKKEILGYNKDYIWAVKPHFTQDDKIVFLSRLPYNAQKRGIFLWYASYNGMDFKMIQELSFDINSIKYDGFDENGGLKIISDGKVYTLERGSFRLK